MFRGVFFVFFTFILICYTLEENSEEYQNELARGWGDKINWYTLDESYKYAHETGKPIMVIIHKTWCGACKALKPQFAGSADIQHMAEMFVMVNLQDDEEPLDNTFAPDGAYIPRILFLDPEGNVRPGIYNEQGDPKYKYYYTKPSQITNSMMLASELGAGKLPEPEGIPPPPVDDTVHIEL